MITADPTEAELREAIETMTAAELRTLLNQVYAQSGGIH